VGVQSVRFDGYITDSGQLTIEDPSGFSQLMDKLAGAPIWVTVVKREKRRSMPQNRYYWKVVVGLLMDHTGYAKDEMHEILRARFLTEPDDFGCPGRIRSTAELTTAEAEVYFREIREWASANLGCYIPEPNEVEGSVWERTQG
jgi:hypothetical protein